MVLALALAACSGSDSDSQKACTQSIVLTDDENYSYEGRLNFPEYPAKSETNFTVDWSAMTKDMLCHDIEPGTIGNAGLTLFAHTDCTTLEDEFSQNTVQQNEVAGYVNNPIATETSVSVSEMTFNGYTVDAATYFTQNPDACWLFSLTETDDFSSPVINAAILTPTDSSDVTTVELQDYCDTPDFTANMHDLVQVPVDSSACSYDLDWTQVLFAGHTTDGVRDGLKVGEIDTILVAHYPDWTVTDLETNFIDLEVDADGLWRETLPSADSVASLDGLAADDGSAFPGFDTTGVWILALSKSSAQNPAPLVLAVLAPY